MKSDLDTLMTAADLDALLVVGPAQHNPPMVYLTGGGHLTEAYLVKQRGEAAVLFYRPMERDEAAKTGLPTQSLGNYLFESFRKQVGGDSLQASVLFYQHILTEAGVTSGRVAVYGKVEIGPLYPVLTALQKQNPEIDLVGEVAAPVLSSAMATKDEVEVDRIRRMGEITTRVVGKVADFLTAQRAKNNLLVTTDGMPVTVRDVKRMINLWLAEEGVENPEGTIFAIGRDAGVPHSAGTPGDSLTLGQTIVFDIFPCEAGGGYYYDFTRTWCLGYAPDEAQGLYEDVLAVYQQIMGELKANAPCRPYQERVCELFEGLGHPTVGSDPQTTNGYVHGLGHGLGLNVHERPMIGQTATDQDRLEPGVIVTVEPGLYYPDQGMGVRLENTVWVRPDGGIEVMADYPLDLVLPLKT